MPQGGQLSPTTLTCRKSTRQDGSTGTARACFYSLNDGGLQHRISSPSEHLRKRYLVQVDGAIDAAAMQNLLDGVQLKDGPARALEASGIETPDLWPRDPPVRERKAIPTSWLQLVIDEGRNRQVRRMTAAVGHPTLRLVRAGIGPWSLDSLQPGKSRELDAGALSSPT